MDSISILTSAEEISLEDIAGLVKGVGLSTRRLEQPHPFLNVYSGDVYKYVSPLCQIDVSKISPASHDLGFEPEELQQLLTEGIKCCLFISCHIESLKKIRPLIKAILVRWGGFVMFEEFNDRYTLETVDKYKPR